MQFCTLDSSKIEVFKTYFFDIVITQNDHPSYVKHVLGCIYVFFTLFGYWGGGVVPWDGYTTCLCGFSPYAAQKSKFSKLITSQRLLDQSQAGVYMGKTPHTPPFWPFWGYSRTLPQGVELLV